MNGEKMTGQDFRAATVERAWEPPEEVVIKAELAYDDALQPEDYGVLIRLLLRDPELPASVAVLSKEWQEAGWKMGDSRLRGVMRRLKKAGHVDHRQVGYDATSGRPKWAFAVYRNPANNPQHMQSSVGSAQVRPTRGISTDEVAQTLDSALIFNGCAGQADTLKSNASETHLLESHVSESNGCAGQADTLKSNGWVGHPPHPPEEVTTSSPYPLTGGPSSLPSQREEEAGSSPTDEQLAAAAAWLGRLPFPWTLGRQDAKELAPLLLEAAVEQGWQLDDDLVAELTKNPAGIHNHARILRKTRIPNLVHHSMITRKDPQRPAQAPNSPFPHQDPDAPMLPPQEAAERIASIKAMLAGVRSPNI